MPKCATLVTWSEDPKTNHKKLYSELNPMEGEIKENRNPGGRMGWTAIWWPHFWHHMMTVSVVSHSKRYYWCYSIMFILLIFIVQKLGGDLPKNNNNILIKSKSRFLRFDYTKVRECTYGFVVVLCYLCIFLETLTWGFPGFSLCFMIENWIALTWRFSWF
jgi:hypothetical protein